MASSRSPSASSINTPPAAFEEDRGRVVGRGVRRHFARADLHRPCHRQMGFARALRANQRQRAARPRAPFRQQPRGVAVGFRHHQRGRRALAHAEFEQSGLCAHRRLCLVSRSSARGARNTGPMLLSSSVTPRRASSAASCSREPVNWNETSAPSRPTASMRMPEISVAAAPSSAVLICSHCAWFGVDRRRRNARALVGVVAVGRRGLCIRSGCAC